LNGCQGIRPLSQGNVKVNSEPQNSCIRRSNKIIKSQISGINLFGAWTFHDFHQTGNFKIFLISVLSDLLVLMTTGSINHWQVSYLPQPALVVVSAGAYQQIAKNMQKKFYFNS